MDRKDETDGKDVQDRSSRPWLFGTTDLFTAPDLALGQQHAGLCAVSVRRRRKHDRGPSGTGALSLLPQAGSRGFTWHQGEEAL